MHIPEIFAEMTAQDWRTFFAGLGVAALGISHLSLRSKVAKFEKALTKRDFL